MRNKIYKWLLFVAVGITGRLHALPLPVSYTVTGGGSYCDHHTSPHIGLSGSDTGVLYQLYLNGITLEDTLSGSGSPLDFGTFSAMGSYSVIALNKTTLATRNMTGSVPVIIMPVPAVYNLSGGGSYCYGGSGKDVSLNLSNSGVLYQLYDNGATIGAPRHSTGYPLDFGLQTDSGTYSVIAIDSVTGCFDTMTGRPSIRINPLPAVDTIAGGGSFCPGGWGFLISLDQSDTSINYSLFRNDSLLGSAWRGTGYTLFFGLQTGLGNYKVIASNPLTTCSDTMAGVATISLLPPPPSSQCHRRWQLLCTRIRC